MANTVDERIVEARFDSQQFEKGVDKTVKKLDELKEALNLDKAGKTLSNVADEASKGIEKAGNTLQKLSDRLTTFKGMVKQQILGGLAEEVSNVFLTIERSVTGLVKSLSTQQIGAGLNKYSEILTSVRTMTAAGIAEDTAYEKIKRLAEYSDQTSYSLSQMTSGMSKLVAAGVDVDKAEKSMEGLANMCASAGVNIYDAQRAFYNFSQAMSTGSMQTRDWISFENLNMATEGIKKVFMEAAVEVGTLTKTVDKNGNAIYKTSNKINKKVKANKDVTVTNLRDTLSYGWFDKETMIRATAISSYFEDLGKDMSKLTDEELRDFAAKAYQSAKEAKSFADVMGTLKDVIATGWATSFELIFGKLEKATEFFTWLTESHLAEAIYAIGDFRNAVLTAWGADFLDGGIFKKGQTGRDYLLDSLKKIDDLLGAIHNSLTTLFPEEFNSTLGRALTFPEMIGKRLGEMSFALDKSATKLLDYFTVVEVVEEDGEKVEKRFLKSGYADRFGKIAEGIGSAFQIIGKGFSIASETISKIFYKVQPIFDAIGDAVGKFLQPITDLNNNGDFFQNITESIDNLLTIIDPFIEPAAKFISFLGDVAAFFLEGSIGAITSSVEIFSDALGLLIELFGGTSAQKAEEGVGVIEGWRNKIHEFGEVCKEAFGSVKEFFTALFDDIRKIFGIGGDVEEGGLFQNISKFFETNEFVQKVKAWIDQAIKDIGDWIQDIPNKVSSLGEKFWNFIHSIFYTKDENGEEVATPFKKWIDEIVEKVKNWVLDLPGKISRGLGKLGNFAKNIWNSIDEFIFGKKKLKLKKVDGKNVYLTERVKSGFSLWLSNLAISIGNWLKTIPEKATNIWNSIIDFLFGRRTTQTRFNPETGKNEQVTVRVKEGFSKWLNDAIKKVSDWVAGLPAKFGAAIAGIWRGLYSGFFVQLAPEYTPPDVENSEQLKTLESSFETWTRDAASAIRGKILSILGNVYEFIKDIWDAIIEVFFSDNPEVQPSEVKPKSGDDDAKTQVVESGIKTWVKGALLTIKGKLSEILSDIKELWSAVLDFIFGPSSNPGTEPTVDAKEGEPKTDSVIAGIISWLGGVKQTIKDGAQGIWDGIKEVWRIVLNALFGNGDNNEIAKEAENTSEGEELKETVVQAASDMIIDLGERIGAEISKLPEEIAKGIDFGAGLITDFFTSVTGWFQDETAKKKLLDETGEGVNDLAKGLSKRYEKAKEQIAASFAKDNNGNIIDQEGYQKALAYAAKQIGYNGEEEAVNPLLQAITSIGQTLYGLITQTIPGFFTSGFEYLKTMAPGWWGAVTDLFASANIDWDEIGERAATIGLKIADVIEKIPGYVDAAVTSISNLFGSSGQENVLGAVRKEVVDEYGRIINDTETDVDYLLSDAGGHFKDADRKLNIGDAVKSIGTSIKNALVQLGPYILDGFTAALGFIGEGLEWVTDFLNGRDKNDSIGESLDKALAEDAESGKNTKFGESLKRLGEKLKHTITETIPRFITAAIDELKVQIPKLADSLFDMFNLFGSETEKTADKVSEKIDNSTVHVEKASLNGLSYVKGSEAELEQLKDQIAEQQGWDKVDATVNNMDAALSDFGSVLQTINNFGSNIANSGAAKLAAIALIVWGISKVLDNLFTLDDIGYDAKWGAIKVAIEGILGVIAYMLILSATGNDTELERVQTLFGDLIEVVRAIGDFFIVLKGLSFATSVADIFSKTNGFWGFISGIITAPLKIFGTGLAVTSVVDMAGEAAYQVSESAAESMATISVGFEDMQTAIDTLAEMNPNITPAIETLHKIPEFLDEIRNVFLGSDSGHKTSAEKFGDALSLGSKAVSTVLGAQANPLYYLVSNAAEDIAYNIASAQKVNRIVDQYDEFATIMSKISGAISTFKNAITTNKITDDTSSVTSAILQLTDMATQIGTFGALMLKPDYKKKFDAFKEGMMSLGAAMQFYSLGNMSVLESGIKPETVQNAIDLLSQMFSDNQLTELITATTGDITTSETKSMIENAEAITIFAGALSMIAKACIDIDDNTADNINKLFGMMDDIVLPENVTDVSKNVGEIGNALGLFMANTSGVADVSVENAKEAINMLVTLAQGLKDVKSDSFFSKVFGGGETLTEFGIKINAFGQDLATFMRTIRAVGDETPEESALNRFERMMQVASIVMVAIGEMIGSMGEYPSEQAFSLLKNLPDFGDDLCKFSNNFVGSLTADVNKENLEKAVSIVGMITDVGNMITNLGLATGWDFSESSRTMKQFMELINVIRGEEYQGSHNRYGYGLQPIISWITDAGGIEDQVSDISLENLSKIQAIVGIFTDIGNTIANLANANVIGKGGFTLMSSQLVASVEEILSSSVFSSIGYSAGENLDAGLTRGIDGNSDAPVKAAQKLKDSINKVFTGGWVIRSPSHLFANFGRMLDLGLAQGIDTSAVEAFTSAEALMEGVEEAFASGKITPESFVKNFFDIDGMGKEMSVEMSKQFKSWEEQNDAEAMRLYEEELAKMSSGINETTEEAVKNTSAGLGDLIGAAWRTVARHYRDPLGFEEDAIKQTKTAAEKVVEVSKKALLLVEDKVIQLGNKYAPSFTDALLGTGLLEGNWNAGDTVTNLCDIMGGLLKDVSAASDNKYVDFACDMIGDILTAVKNQSDGTGENMMASIMTSLLKNVSNYSDNMYVDIASMMLSGMIKNFEAESEETGKTMVSVMADHLKSEGLGTLLNFGPQFVKNLFGIDVDKVLNDTGLRSLLEHIRDMSAEDMDIQVTITPVVDMSNVTQASGAIAAMGFGSAFGVQGITGLNTLGMSVQGVDPRYNREPVATKDYSEIIGSIRNQMSTLASEISSGVSGSFSGIQVVLDTGAIVGGIIDEVDSQLGRREFYASRG